MQSKKILIVVPAFNEEKSISSVVQDIRKHLPSVDILVVNDGSSDRTSEKAVAAGAFVVDLPYNLGIGATMQTGYMFAERESYDIAVQCDGDGQHPPYQIKNLITPLLEGKADIAAGSRFLGNFGYRSSIPRQIGIILFSGILTAITKTRFTDPTCGFRAINKRAIKSFSAYYPHDYPEVEVLVLAHKKGLKMREVPIRIYKRKEGSSSIGFFGSFYYTVKVLLAIFVDLFKSAS